MIVGKIYRYPTRRVIYDSTDQKFLGLLESDEPFVYLGTNPCGRYQILSAKGIVGFVNLIYPSLRAKEVDSSTVP